MKNFIAKLFLVSIISSASMAFAENVVLYDADDLDFRTENGEEVVYDEDGNLYSGAVILPDEESRQVTYFYQNGKKNGVASSRFTSGKFELQTTYVDGKKNGDEILFYSDEKPKYKRTYKNNIPDGEEILYYENGKPQKQSHYADGELNGTVRYFDENGNLTRIETYKDGIKDGVEHIVENNVLREENHYTKGKLNGISKRYDEKYLTDEIKYVDGKKNGIHKTYGSDGSWREIPYVDDKKEGEGRIFYPNKALWESVLYANDKRNGLHQKFSVKGDLIFSENYKDDLKDGISRYFDDKNRLTSVSYYMDGVELSRVDIDKRSDLKDIQESIFDEKLSKYSNKRNLWYKILWLALNMNKPEVLETLEKEMKMYAVDANDIRVYERYSGSQFESENKQLFFGLTPLGYAVYLESPIEILQKFINQIEDKNSRGLTILRDTVCLNKTEMLKFLLLNGADLKETDNEGNDILLYAIISDSPFEMIENIIKAGGNVNTKNNLEQMPLTVALAKKDIKLVKLLIESGANLQITPDGQNLLYFAYNKKVPQEILSELIKKGLDINSTDSEGNNLLLKALKDKDEEIALFALNHGADINQKDNEGETAVSYVLFNKASPQVIEEIFKKDYDFEHKLEKQNKMLWKVLLEQNRLDLLKKTWDKMPNIAENPDTTGELPFKTALDVNDNPQLKELALSYIQKADDQMLWNALKDKDFSLFTELLAKKANINSKNSDGDSLLMYMVKNDYDRKFMDAVIVEDFNIDAEDRKMQTALDIAIKKNDLELVEYLLKAGANPDRKINGETYITRAVPSQEKLVRLLMKYTKNIPTELPDNEPLLMRAVQNLNIPLFDYLTAQENVNFNIKDDNGNSLLLNAADYFAVADDKDDEKELTEKFLYIAKFLLDKGLDINLRNGNGESLLIKLAKHSGSGYEKMSKFLIDKGADIEPKDQYNKRAADYRSDKNKGQEAKI